MEDTLKNKLKYLINKKKTLPEICEALELKDYEVIGLVELMKQDGELLDYVNGEIVKMDVPARLINDKTMIPLRFLSENLGYEVEWNEENNTAIVRQ